MSRSKPMNMMDARILGPALGESFKKLNPRSLARNPVMFVVAVVSALTTIFLAKENPVLKDSPEPLASLRDSSRSPRDGTASIR